MINAEDDNWLDAIHKNIISGMGAQVDQLEFDIAHDPVSRITSEQENEISDPSLIRFYRLRNWWIIGWETKNDLPMRAEGRFDIRSPERVLFNCDEEMGVFDDVPDLKGFRHIDMFNESGGSVGFFVGREKEKKGLYLNRFEGRVEPMHVDFEGYLKLLGMSKGYLGWQNALIIIHSKKDSGMADSFKLNMPLLFPDFNWDEFVKLYESLRIDK